MVPLVLFLSLFLLPSCYSLPMCKDSTYPIKLNTTLSFCGYMERACCTAADDLAMKDQFTNMNISNAACAHVIKSILCAQCNTYAFELYKTSQKFPVLCNNTDITSAPPTNSTTGFCTVTWDACKDVAISNSPFSNDNTLPTKLSDTYKSATDFCTSTHATAIDHTVCFNGGISVGFNGTQSAPAPQGICLERLFNMTYNNFQPHPDGSNRVFLATQSGKIFLATMSPQGSGKTLDIDLANPFIDLTDVVLFDNVLGLTGFAFHPNFGTNGRFFVAYNCDKSKSATCSGRCSCNSEINCEPSKLGKDQGAMPCQYHAVIAEYTVNGTSTSPNMIWIHSTDRFALYKVPALGKYRSEGKDQNQTRIQVTDCDLLCFSIFLGKSCKSGRSSQDTHHGAPIHKAPCGTNIFGPTDGYLYFTMGDGGNAGDPWNFAQTKKALLGKSLRLNIDVMPSQAEIDNLTLWGNYSIPKDNPYYTDKTFRPEVYSYGHRNPWRCTFDFDRPNYLFCGETSQDTYEEINLIEKGGNYGWRIYQGNDLYNPPWAPGPNISANSIDPIFPVLGYNRSEANSNLGSAAIVAGYVYRAKTDPCLYERYIYADLYANDMWVAAETPRGSGNFSKEKITCTCSKTSPIPCDYTGKSTLPSLGYIFSFAQDNSKDLFFLTSKGVYRVVRPSLCNYTCPIETLSPPPPPASTPSSSLQLKTPIMSLLVCLFILLGSKI